MRRALAIAALAALALAGCDTVPVAVADTTSTTKATTTTAKKTDEQILSVGPCNHFKRVSTKVAVGTLSLAELRGEVKEISSGAAYATPEVSSASVRMLRAVTQLDDIGFASASVDMRTACQEAGAW